MAREIEMKLARADEETIFELLQRDGFAVLSKHLSSADLLAAAWKRLPTDEEARDWEDYDCATLPVAILGQITPLATDINLWLEAGRTGRPRGDKPPAPFVLEFMHAPMISWNRTRRRAPKMSPEKRLLSSLRLVTRWDYGPFNKWVPEVKLEYDRLLKEIRKLTRKETIGDGGRGAYIYVSSKNLTDR